MIKKKFCAVLLFCSALPVSSQTLETIFEEYSETYISDLSEFLRNIHPQPLALNEIDDDSLASLWFLSPQQSAALIALRKARAGRLSYRDIARELDLPGEIVRIFFSLQQSRHPRLALRQRLRRTIPASPQSDTRIGVYSTSAEAGWLFEKDADEKQLTDFSALYLQRTFRNRHTLVMGDFTLRSGLGLVFNGPYGISSLNSPANMLRYGEPTLLPHRSTAENIAFRGAAVKLRYGTRQLLFFASASRRDARISEQGVAISLPESGYHRTASEQATRDRLRIRSSGVLLDWFPTPRVRLGTGFFREGYAPAIQPPDSLRRRYAFRGKNNGAAFFSWRIRLGASGAIGSGEIAIQPSGARAGLLALTWRLSGFVLTAGAWHAEPDFQLLYGSLPGRGLGDTGNRTAAYLGIVSRRGTPGKLSAYLLRSGMPWRSYFIPAPAQEQRLFLQWENRLRRRLNLLLRLQFRRRPEVTGAEASRWQPSGKIIIDRRRTEVRSQAVLALWKPLSWRIRFDFTHSEQADRPETGHAWMQELILKRRHTRLAVRYSRFAVSDYDARIYQFEYRLQDDLQGVFFTGRGWRFLATATVRFYAPVRFSLYSWMQQREGETLRRGFGVQLNFTSG